MPAQTQVFSVCGNQVTLPRLQFHMSPARLSRVMAVVNDLTGPAAAQQQPAWVKEVDFSGDVRLLTWSGMSFSNAAWEERWGALWVSYTPAPTFSPTHIQPQLVESLGF